MPEPRDEIWASRHGLWSRSPPPPASKTPHDRYVLGEVADRMAEALRKCSDFLREDGIAKDTEGAARMSTAYNYARCALAEYEKEVE